MENKNNATVFYILFLIIGIFVGFAISKSNNIVSIEQTPEMHQMSDGSMMHTTPKMDMAHTMEGMMAGLNGKTGDNFDKAFLSEMIVHHEGAVLMAQAVLQTSKRPELLKLANDIISAQTGEITTMQNWQKEWFK